MKHNRQGQDGSHTYLVPGENPMDETSRTYPAIEVTRVESASSRRKIASV